MTLGDPNKIILLTPAAGNLCKLSYIEKVAGILDDKLPCVLLSQVQVLAVISVCCPEQDEHN